MVQSQQDTKFEIGGTVSTSETMFHLSAKLREVKQFVSADKRQKGAPTCADAPFLVKALL